MQSAMRLASFWNVIGQVEVSSDLEIVRSLMVLGQDRKEDVAELLILAFLR